MNFEVIGNIESVETIAVGSAIHEIASLRKTWGGRRWRKMKGVATVSLENGAVRRVEAHWYEQPSVGKRKLKIKQYLD